MGILKRGWDEMTHFEYMQQQGQMTIFELLDEYELFQFRKSSTKVSRSADKKKAVGPKRVGYIVRG